MRATAGGKRGTNDKTGERRCVWIIKQAVLTAKYTLVSGFWHPSTIQNWGFGANAARGVRWAATGALPFSNEGCPAMGGMLGEVRVMQPSADNSIGATDCS